MGQVCAVLGLEMNQKFIVTEKGLNTAYKKNAPYFFTECGIFSEKTGKPCPPDLLDSLVKGTVSADPLRAYAYKCADTINVRKISGQELKTEIASFMHSAYGEYGGDGVTETKALYAVITPDRPDITWRLEHTVDTKDPVHTNFKELTQAVEAYNKIRMTSSEYDW